MKAADSVNDTGESFREGSSRVVHVCFGDRVGFLIFVGAMLFFALTWRLEPIINDTYTPLDALLAASGGNLYINELVWSPKTGAPGLHAVDERLYGRNYGQIFLALPLYWLFEAATAVADLRILLAAGWSLLLVTFIDRLGIVLGKRSIYAPLGAGFGIVFFTVNAWFATPLSPALTSLIAMQLSTMIVAALVGVVIYRFFTDIYDSRTGIVGGVGIVLASPIGFWAIFPKRHSLTVLATMLVISSMYFSRSSDDPSEALRYRALSYVWVALFAWIHAPEAFILLVGLGIVDVFTSRTNRGRNLIFVGGVFLVSLLPFLVTNYLISGNPMVPPRMLPSPPGESWSLVDGVVVEAGEGSQGNQGASPGAGLSFTGIVSTVLTVFLVFVRHVSQSLSTIDQPDKFYHTFVRGGYVESVAPMDRNIAMRLSMLESMPTLGALVGIPMLAYRRFDGTAHGRKFTRNPLFATDSLVCILAALFLITYWPRVPIHASLTVRYLHPLYPLGLYGLIRIPAVRSVISRQSSILTWSYASFVLIGGQLLVVIVATLALTIGEAVQLHALLSLGAAILVIAWALVACRYDGYARSGAVVFGLAAAIATLYLLLSGLIYFSFTSNYGLPMSRVIADALQVLDGPVSFSR